MSHDDLSTAHDDLSHQPLTKTELPMNDERQLRRRRAPRLLTLIASLLVVAAGCLFDSETAAPIEGSRHVTQGGAQDIAEFRRIVEDGDVPSVEVLDEIGFFAEHGFDLPPADCGQDICVQPMLAVAPRFGGGNWTMAFVGLNAPESVVAELPPVHHVLVVEALPSVEEAVRAFADAARPGDRITLVYFGVGITVAAEAVEPSDAALRSLGDVRVSSETPRLYEALSTAAELALEPVLVDEEALLTRVLLLSSARADDAELARTTSLVDALGRAGMATSIVGAGDGYVQRNARALIEVGGGTLSRAAT